MNLSGFLAVGLGGLLGCWLRWILAVLLNHTFPNLPPGGPQWTKSCWPRAFAPLALSPRGPNRTLCSVPGDNGG